VQPWPSTSSLHNVPQHSEDDLELRRAECSDGGQRAEQQVLDRTAKQFSEIRRLLRVAKDSITLPEAGTSLSTASVPSASASQLQSSELPPATPVAVSQSVLPSHQFSAERSLPEPPLCHLLSQLAVSLTVDQHLPFDQCLETDHVERIMSDYIEFTGEGWALTLGTRQTSLRHVAGFRVAGLATQWPPR
jgi:hypothetical protein